MTVYRGSARHRDHCVRLGLAARLPQQIQINSLSFPTLFPHFWRIVGLLDDNTQVEYKIPTRKIVLFAEDL